MHQAETLIAEMGAGASLTSGPSDAATRLGAICPAFPFRVPCMLLVDPAISTRVAAGLVGALGMTVSAFSCWMMVISNLIISVL